MFKTIFTVRKFTDDSTEYRAYFEDFDEAKKFAESEVEKMNERYVYKKKTYFDGSVLYSWMFDHHLFWLHDNAWLTDFRVNGIGFYDDSGSLYEFDTMADFQSWLALRNRLAINVS